ncbi:MAG: hypothetical protein ABIJ08_07575 [Nanoarchaeota archaeon]
MRIPKRYGMSRVDSCPFCSKQAVTKNKQGVPVCVDHKSENLNNIKCVCGEYLDVREGKFGPYFHCINCGNINFKKGIEMNPKVEKKQTVDIPIPKTETKKEYRKKEITITSDDVEYF